MFALFDKNPTIHCTTQMRSTKKNVQVNDQKCKSSDEDAGAYLVCNAPYRIIAEAFSKMLQEVDPQLKLQPQSQYSFPGYNRLEQTRANIEDVHQVKCFKNYW